jgi:hypothetical protein
MVDTEKGERDRLVVLTKYPDAFCARNPGEPWQVMRARPYVALSGKRDTADEAWADAANTVQAAERLTTQELVS